MITIKSTEYKDWNWKAILSTWQKVFMKWATEEDKDEVLKSFQSLVDSKNNQEPSNPFISI